MYTSVFPEIIDGLAFLSILQFLCVLSFMVFVETEQNGFIPLWKTLKKPVNTSLIVGTLSIIGYNFVVSRMLSIYGSIFAGEGAWPIGVFSFLSTMELSYLHYSWYRSESIITHIFPSFSSILRISLHLSPFLICTQIIPPVLHYVDIITKYQARDIIFVLAGFIGIYVTLFDCVMVYSFVRFLQSLRFLDNNGRHSKLALGYSPGVSPKPNHSPSGNDLAKLRDPQLEIIAKYGIVETSLCLIILSSFCAVLVVKEGSLAELILTVICCVLFEAIYLVLLGMKIAIHQNAILRLKENESRLEKVLGKETLKSIRSTMGSSHTVSSRMIDEAVSVPALPVRAQSTYSLSSNIPAQVEKEL
ncbi:hypothetical protein BCR33DRAFT_38977 [Rhizoclosmatium globosum]|uniref:Uncharacterized protein n=1 Tax=Rhizoclosmatium globosum TaxID=329046 RepID=A0A1Y2CNG5_9FUNG|nr:hypothetical protein BCR33DRAFT_38977 [Rhizoclosmatium globosum]|eukprot:ORY48579.1 hypothetical protein BCR33DRAFT_38977 [Rhizoclosmatium globosum]